MELNRIERLLSLLWLDCELPDLFREGIQKTSLERCENNLRRSLLLYSARLRNQASTSVEKGAARYIKFMARDTAHLFAAKIDLQADEIIHTESRASLHQTTHDVVEDVVVEESLAEEEELQISLNDKVTDYENLESFLKNADALTVLKDSFRLFIHPDPVRKAMLNA